MKSFGVVKAGHCTAPCSLGGLSDNCRKLEKNDDWSLSSVRFDEDCHRICKIRSICHSYHMPQPFVGCFQLGGGASFCTSTLFQTQ